MHRREFLQSTIAGTAALGSATAAPGGSFPKRKFKDDVELSIIGFGGIVVMGHDQSEADRIVADSVERGINYFDVAPSYGNGEAELKLGPALKPFRKDVFLACKTGERKAEGAQRELEQSLRRAYTDHFDLYQFHGITGMDDVEQILGPGGAAEVFMKARKDGKVRYLGVSAHSAEAAIALMDRMELDSILFPVNYVCYGQGNFGPQILEKAKSKGMARLALKAMAQTQVPKGENRPYDKCWYQPVEDRALAEKALRFTLSQDITAAIPPGEGKFYQMALEMAPKFSPLEKNEEESLLASAAGIEPIFRA